jgi:hypothetical protein
VPAALVHEDLPPYAGWLKVVIVWSLVLTGGLGFALLPVNPAAAAVLLGVTVFDALLFHFVLPRKYQIFTDRLRVVLGRPFAFNVPLGTIAEARPVSGIMALAGGGIRFATTTSTVVKIVRSRGMNVVISPRGQDLFLEHLQSALEAQRAGDAGRG